MTTALSTGELVIGVHNWQTQVNPVVDGETKRHGLIPRDYITHPRGCYAGIKAVDVPLIPSSEYASRIADKIQQASQLSDLRNVGNAGQPIPSRDQNGKGFCWAHSGTSAHLLVRAKLNLPYADLSAYAVACIIKGFADEGGWGAQGVDFQMQKGIPTSKTWPQQSMSRSNDNPNTWAEASTHKIVDEWADLAAAQYDRNLSFDQLVTLLLSDTSVVVDFNWWSHSVCAMDAVNGATMRSVTRDDSGKIMPLSDFDTAWGMNDPVTGGIGIRIWNSWGDSWSQNGTGILTGSHAVPDGSVAPRMVTASP